MIYNRKHCNETKGLRQFTFSLSSEKHGFVPHIFWSFKIYPSQVASQKQRKFSISDIHRDLCWVTLYFHSFSGQTKDYINDVNVSIECVCQVSDKGDYQGYHNPT